MMSYMVGTPISQLYLKGRNYIVSPGWHPSNYGARIKIGGQMQQTYFKQPCTLFFPTAFVKTEFELSQSKGSCESSFFFAFSYQKYRFDDTGIFSGRTLENELGYLDYISFFSKRAYIREDLYSRGLITGEIYMFRIWWAYIRDASTNFTNIVKVHFWDLLFTPEDVFTLYDSAS